MKNNWEKLKEKINDKIMERDEEIDQFESLKLLHLREKAHYKKRAYQEVLNEMALLEMKE